MTTSKLAIVIAAIACTSVAQAEPIIMDFESLRVDSEQQVIVHGTSYSEDGFALSVTCCEPVAGPQSTDLRTTGTLAAIYAGSTAMRGGKSNTLITLTASDGGPFNLLSIDLAALPSTQLVDGELVPINTGQPQVVTFEGVNVHGDIFWQTFSHTDFLNLTTYQFDGFSGLTSVSWFQGAGDPNTHQFDNITVESAPEPVDIDIKPGSDPNAVNSRSNGVISVAILGSVDFDATQIDLPTVEFGPDAASPVDDGNVENVNGDGFMDRLFHFNIRDTGIACGDTEATVTGETFADGPFIGTDSVKVVGCQIQAIIDSLADIIAGNAGTNVADKLEDVIDKLQVAPEELAKTPPDNQAAIGNIEGAVGEIEAAVKDGLLNSGEGTQLMDQLAGIARNIAAGAVDQAIAGGGDPSKIDDAQLALGEGDALRASEAFRDAVNKYKDALSQAEGA